MSRSPIGTWLGRLLLVVLSSALALVGVELGLRVFWSGFYLKDAQPIAERDAVRGWRNRPNVVVEYGKPEFHVKISQNNWGFRGRPLEHAKGSKQRVLVLGDSFTYGIGVEDDQTFSARLEQLEPELEVINTGANGYGTGQELILLRDEGLAFDPDIVILAFFWNDLANNVERPDIRFSVKDGQVVYPARRDGLPGVSMEPRRHAWLRYSYAYRFGSDGLQRLRYWIMVQLGMRIVAAKLGDPQRRAEAWEVEEALIREIRALCRERGAKFLLMLIPDQVQVEPEAKVLGLLESDYQVQGPLFEFAARDGIDVLDLLPTLHAEHVRTEQPLYYRQDRHFLPRAHEIAADQIREALRQRGWLGAPASDRTALTSRDD
jgi:hypothetical protein